MAGKYKNHEIPTERTYLMIKPDGVMRGLIGEIIGRMEKRGLKIVAMKMLCPTKTQVDGHYPKNAAWIERLGTKTLGTFEEYGLDAKELLGTDSASEVGQTVRDNILEYITMGPVVAMVVEGIHAIAVVRKLVGSTLPIYAEPGTIRGDYSHDAPTAANLENRSIYNIVHASETAEEAEKEIKHWFETCEVCDFDLSDHVIMFGDKREQ